MNKLLESNKLLQLLRPYQTSFKKIRLGPPYDGGYVLADIDLKNLDYILTFGIGPSIDFERDLVRNHAKNCVVIACDPNVDAEEIKRRNSDINCRIFSIGLGSEFQDNPIVLKPLYQVEDTTKMDYFNHYGNTFYRKNILKVDIEGNEWDVFSKIMPYQLRKYEQILLECHFYGGKEDLKCADLAVPVFIQALENVSKFHKLVHIHGNNWEQFVKIDGKLLPHCFELTYIRKDCEPETPYSDEFFPTSIDIPNKPGFPDLMLGEWPFQ